MDTKPYIIELREQRKSLMDDLCLDLSITNDIDTLRKNFNVIIKLHEKIIIIEDYLMADRIHRSNLEKQN